MVPLRALFAAVLGLAALMAQPVDAAAAASRWIDVHGSKVRLVGGTAAPHYLAGLEIVLADGWKTYWRMPGDSGVPPSFDWKGSKNLSRATVRYPAPTRMPEAGGEAVGYKGTVVFPIAVVANDPKAPVSVRLALEFGLCREICIPAMIDLSLELSSGDGAAPEAVTSFLKRVPRAQADRRQGDPELKQVRIRSDRIEIEGTFKGSPASADAFVEAPEGLYVPMLKRQAGTSRFSAPLSADLIKDLKGKTLTLTLVDDAGASEAQWTFP
jgi:DsbC/DsbD-like thiol-disulfide interchange protein